MGLFSFFRKNKQESASGKGEFLSRSAGESAAVRSRRSGSNARKSTKEEASDPMVPEKKRARRRLIGAIALVLAMVIVLPMIFDSEPRPLANDIAIQIPSKDGKDNALAGKVADAPVLPAADSAGTTAPQAGKAALTAATAEVPAAEPPEPPQSAAKVDVKEPLKETPAEGRMSAPSTAKAPARSDGPQTGADDSARSMAILEGKPASAEKKPAIAASGGKFVIQVAALATPEKIKELRGKLSSAGIKSFTQKVATQDGERTRIRVGPFVSHEEANKMRLKINKLGLNATIVAP